MPKRYPKGGESRLSLEGLHGVEFRGKVIRSIYAHGERRRQRTVFYTDGTSENVSIEVLVDVLVKSKEK